MFDIHLRPLKDAVSEPLCALIPSYITPLHLTALAFLCGVSSCYVATLLNPQLSLILWLLNRLLDCLDGALARRRSTASDLGGFLDLLGDFIVYSGIPICCAIAADGHGVIGGVHRRSLWLAVSSLEATFHVNNFVLFYIGAVVEKRRATAATAKVIAGRNGDTTDSTSNGKGEGRRKGHMTVPKEETAVKELTSVAMRPALVEGMESGVLFTVMLALPAWTEEIAWVMAALVCVGIAQRVAWVVPVLGRTA